MYFKKVLGLYHGHLIIVTLSVQYSIVLGKFMSIHYSLYYDYRTYLPSSVCRDVG